MKLTAQEMVDSVRFHLDHVNSPRYGEDKVLFALNTAQERILNDRYNNIKIPKTYSFQTSERIRNELKNIIPEPAEMNQSGEVFLYPDNYRFLLLLDISYKNKIKDSKPTTWHEIGTLRDDPFASPTPNRIYHIEDGRGINVLMGEGIVPEKVFIHYIRNPKKISLNPTQDCELGETMHEEITIVAAQILKGITEDYRASQYKEAEAIKS